MTDCLVVDGSVPFKPIPASHILYPPGFLRTAAISIAASALPMSVQGQKHSKSMQPLQQTFLSSLPPLWGKTTCQRAVHRRQHPPAASRI